MDQMDHKQCLLDVLVSLKQNGPEAKNAGICHAVFNSPAEHDVVQYMDTLMKEWPDGTGWSTYPIPKDGKILNHNSLTSEELQQEIKDAEFAYWRHKANQWDKEDPYCQARYRLLDWMIQRLEEELK